MAGKNVLGLVLVLGAVAAAGWCFMAGPCKTWLDQAGGLQGILGNVEGAIGGVLKPVEDAISDPTGSRNKLIKNLESNLPKGPPVPTGASDGSIVSQQQMPFSAPPPTTASFAQSFMGHLSYT